MVFSGVVGFWLELLISHAWFQLQLRTFKLSFVIVVINISTIIHSEFLRPHLLTSKAQRCREVLIHRGSSLSGLLEDPLSILPLRCLVSSDGFLLFSLYPFLLRALLFLNPFAFSTFTFVLSSSSSL